MPFIEGYQQLANQQEIDECPDDLNSFGGLCFDLKFDDEPAESKVLWKFDLDCDGQLSAEIVPLELFKESPKLFLYWEPEGRMDFIFLEMNQV